MATLKKVILVATNLWRCKSYEKKLWTFQVYFNIIFRILVCFLITTWKVFWISTLILWLNWEFEASLISLLTWSWEQDGIHETTIFQTNWEIIPSGAIPVSAGSWAKSIFSLSIYMVTKSVHLRTAPSFTKIFSCPDPGSTGCVGHLVPGKRKYTRLTNSRSWLRNTGVIAGFLSTYSSSIWGTNTGVTLLLPGVPWYTHLVTTFFSTELSSTITKTHITISSPRLSIPTRSRWSSCCRSTWPHWCTCCASCWSGCGLC